MEVKDELMKSKATGSLSKISIDEIERIRMMRHIYREKKGVEGEATPSSKAEPTRARYVSRALNE